MESEGLSRSGLPVDSAGIARTRTTLHIGRTSSNDLVLLLQAKLDTIVTRRVERVVDREVPLDLALPGLVRLAVGLGLGPRVIPPVPLDRRAIKVLVIVGSSLEIGGQHHSRGGEAHNRRYLDGNVWLVFLIRTGGLRRHRKRQCTQNRREQPAKTVHVHVNLRVKSRSADDCRMGMRGDRRSVASVATLDPTTCGYGP